MGTITLFRPKLASRKPPPGRGKAWARQLAAPLALLGALLGAFVAAADDPARPPSRGAPSAAEILTGAIRIPTVNPPGDEAPLARYFVDLLNGFGVEAAVVPTPPGHSGLGRAAAWGRLRGDGSRPAVVLLSHLDVVPAVIEEWSVYPFAGTRVDGWVMGRGAVDAKGMTVVQLLALQRLAQRREKLMRDVIFLATPDEETGGSMGAGYLARERPDLVAGAAYLLTEGGGVLVRDEDERALWGVGVTEKSPCWLRVVSQGSAGHSSLPRRDAAVPRLIAALYRVQNLETPVRVVPPVEAMFAALAPLAPPEDRAGFSDLALGLEQDEAFRGRFLARGEYAALVRDTHTTTVLEGSTRTNMVPSVASAHIDARLLPGESCGTFAEQVRSVLADPGISVETLLAFPSRESSPDTPLFRAIERVANRVDPGAVVVPRVTAGFTDAHYFRELGLAAYGFVPRWSRAGEALGVHAHDERISVENLERGIDILVEILVELDRVESEEEAGAGS